MTDADSTPRRSSPAGLIVGLAALGLLLALLLFRSSPDADVPVDQGQMASALVGEMMTNGVLVDYDCSTSTAWVNRAVWTRYNFEQRRNMVIGLATVCDMRRAGYRISMLDYETKREIAAFDGTAVKMDEP